MYCITVSVPDMYGLLSIMITQKEPQHHCSVLFVKEAQSFFYKYCPSVFVPLRQSSCVVNGHHSLLFIGVLERRANYQAFYGKLFEIANSKKLLLPDDHTGVMPTCEESKFTLVAWLDTHERTDTYIHITHTYTWSYVWLYECMYNGMEVH